MDPDPARGLRRRLIPALGPAQAPIAEPATGRIVATIARMPPSCTSSASRHAPAWLPTGLCAVALLLAVGAACAGEAPVKPGVPPRPGPPTAPPTPVAPTHGTTPPPAPAPPVATPPAMQDTVLLVNHQRIAGFIDTTADVGPDQVAINTGNGIIRMPKAQIAGEDLGYPARRRRVQDDDVKGLTELALWCRATGRNPEAFELLKLAVAQAGVTLPARALYARLIDEQQGPVEALPAYQAYRDAGGMDPATLARLAELEKSKADYDAQFGGPVADAKSTDAAPAKAPEPAAAAPAAPATRPGGPVVEGLEARGWDTEAIQWSNPVEVQTIQIDTPDGPSKVLRIAFKGGDKDKSAVMRGMTTSVLDNSVLAFQVKNTSDKPVNISVALKTGDRYVFHESPQKTIQPGDEFQQVRVDLKGSNFKSIASSWANTGKIADLNDVRQLQIIIYNGHNDGELVIDSLGFQGKPKM